MENFIVSFTYTHISIKLSNFSLKCTLNYYIIMYIILNVRQSR
jgi:hypothetical protein